ncbi:MAG: TIGR02757 family protein [Bacteroidales bacterium]|nr:TIGR02757 family protein [Bacteroidales bacterium]
MDWIKQLLDEKYIQYNKPEFIVSDPVSIPHMFSSKENIEVSALLTATLSWGSRQLIIKSAGKLIEMLDNNPYDFLISASEKEINDLKRFYYRTFNGTDTVYFIRSLINIYRTEGGLESIFTNEYKKSGDLKNSIHRFRVTFFSATTPGRTAKHIADVMNGASAKRMNMFLRWMVRKDEMGVDFGLWEEIPASALYLPLDLHTGKIARDLELLVRKQNDWKAVVELTEALRKYDPQDPVKYDFALFGMGVFEKNKF